MAKRVLVPCPKCKDTPGFVKGKICRACSQRGYTIETKGTKVKGEKVNHPQHYGGDVVYEVIKVLHAWGLEKNAYLWNAVKYIARAGKKNDYLEDLKKSRFYLDFEIKKEEERRGAK